tara:strand:- start:50 stop:2146 length:2097 start_codon:yes stop_codon:yes gene_type:complete
MDSKITISLFGNPNAGKTAVFNLLTGLNQKVSNYPGITVEKKISEFRLENNTKVRIEDYPGTYSLNPQSLDEEIVFNSCLSWLNNNISKPDAIVYVLDSTNLRRNLFLLSQLSTFKIPIILLCNMSDLVNVSDLVNLSNLKKELGLYQIVKFSAVTKDGLSHFLEILEKFNNQFVEFNCMPITKTINKIVSPLSKVFNQLYQIDDDLANMFSLFLISDKNRIKNFNLDQVNKEKVLDCYNDCLLKIDSSMIDYLKTIESDIRYGYIDKVLDLCDYNANINIEEQTKSEKIDRILTHKWYGPIIYVGILYFIFQSIFNYASIPMDWIDSGISIIGNYVYNLLPDSWFQSLVVDGIIAGFGGIIIFLPQILFLMLFMILLEETGYMTRVAFMFDKFMRSVGLHGKSILPIMSGYACAIPGIISARTIDSWKERLITILVLPLISCSARLPVYILMISAFVPDIYLFNFIGFQGFMMVAMYFLGTITAFILAIIFSKFLSEKSNPSFIMELPPYRLPILKSVVNQLYIKGKLFVVNAGKIILSISIVLWFLVSFPKNDLGESEISTSYAGKVGHFIEPVIEPLGFDWKIGIGLITSFAAREVVVSTLATIYNVSDEDESMVDLKSAMINDINPKTGKNVFNPIVAVSLMVFYVYAAQCVATFAVVRTETNTWKWPLFMILYMTSLAYIMSFIIFQFGSKFL